MARHLALIDREIRRLVLREIPERVLVVRMPPRHGKSELVSHYTPAWFEANWPDRNTLLASYEATFASDWGRKARDTFLQVTTEEGGELITAKISSQRQAADNWGTTAGGYMATAGVGGGVTGRGFHLGICDDLVKNAEQAQSEVYREKTWTWLTSTFWSRREPEGVMIVVGTPWHRDDYLARLRKWDEPIREISLPAVIETEAQRNADLLHRRIGEPLWPERFDADALASIRLAQGHYYWKALYQGEPTLHEQAEWPADYFQGIDAERWPERFELSAIFVDASEGKRGGDYCAIVFVGLWQGLFYVDAVIARLPTLQLIEATVELARQHRPDEICFEGNQWQKLLVGEYERFVRDRGRFPAAVGYLENYGVRKEVRIRRLGLRLGRKQFRFLRGRPGVELLLEQLKDFPLGDHDDGPDALEGCLRRLYEMADAALEQQDSLELASTYSE